MYAIVEACGKQFRVEEGCKFVVDHLNVEEGSTLTLDKVLMLGGENFKVGTPYIENASVQCEVVAQGRGKKIMVFKRWRRNDSRKMRGHRQDLTTLKVVGISA